MRLVPFEPSMAEAVAQCYNDIVRPAPYCAPVGADRFRDLKRLERAPLSEEALLAAQDEGGDLLGFVHLGVAAPATEPWHLQGEPGILRFLSYQPGRRPVGEALLEAAEAWLRARGRSEVIAGHSHFMYPFYHLPFAHISERISHLPPLFGIEGYTVAESEVFFAWASFEAPVPPKPHLDVEIAIEWRDKVDTFANGVVLNPKRGDKVMGECKIVRLGYEGWRPELRHWCFCTSLHLDESLRGKGLGKYLLALGLREARQRGLRHTLVSTDWDNYRAYLFYTNFGYQFLDRTFSYRKHLTPQP